MGVNSIAVERTSAKGVDFLPFVSILGMSNERQLLTFTLDAAKVAI